MHFALTTRWNAGRHDRGESMIEEIVELGFRHVELGYDTRLDLVPGVKAMVQDGTIQVGSLHNFCPVPVGAPRGHPELFCLASRDERERRLAVQHTSNTIRFAPEVGARVVVTHAGNVDMTRYSEKLCRLHERGQQFSKGYEKLRMKVMTKRDRKVRRHLDQLCRSLEELMPILAEAGARLAVENLPTWEAIPTETEMEELLGRFGTDHLAYWHDTGHGQVRQNLGFIVHLRWLERLQFALAGMHLHDTAPPAYDHLMPPRGKIDFDALKPIGQSDVLRVIEPSPYATKDDIRLGHRYLQTAWQDQEQPEPPSAPEENA
jgi:sugar phosphate isomerase/epimerase